MERRMSVGIEGVGSIFSDVESRQSKLKVQLGHEAAHVGKNVVEKEKVVGKERVVAVVKVADQPEKLRILHPRPLQMGLLYETPKQVIAERSDGPVVTSGQPRCASESFAEDLKDHKGYPP
jgi:hypothetical protein